MNPVFRDYTLNIDWGETKHLEEESGLYMTMFFIRLKKLLNGTR